MDLEVRQAATQDLQEELRGARIQLLLEFHDLENQALLSQRLAATGVVGMTFISFTPFLLDENCEGAVKTSSKHQRIVG